MARRVAVARVSFVGMLALHAVAVALLPGRPPLRRPVAVVASASAPATRPFRTVEVAFGRERYGVSVQALQSYTTLYSIQLYIAIHYTPSTTPSVCRQQRLVRQQGSPRRRCC